MTWKCTNSTNSEIKTVYQLYHHHHQPTFSQLSLSPNARTKSPLFLPMSELSFPAGVPPLRVCSFAALLTRMFTSGLHVKNLSHLTSYRATCFSIPLPRRWQASSKSMPCRHRPQSVVCGLAEVNAALGLPVLARVHSHLLNMTQHISQPVWWVLFLSPGHLHCSLL